MEAITLMLGGARKEIFKPVLDEFKRWHDILEEPFRRHKDR